MLKDTVLTSEVKLQLLLDISRRLGGTLDLDETLEQLLDSVASLIAFDAGGIFVLNEDLIVTPGQRPRQMIANIVWRGYPAHPAADDPMLTHGQGIVGHVIHTGQSVVAPDVRVDPHYVAGRPNTLSEVAVPIRIGERTIGALNLESNALNAFDHTDEAVLCFFADAAALSIDKAILHMRLLEQERMEEQMQLARAVQERLLPVGAPDVVGYDIAGLCVPAFDIGGDYYDYIALDAARIGLVVADVSGEGIPAAMIMTAFRALLRTYARQIEQPEHLAKLLNQLLPDFTGRFDFVTAVYGVLDLETGAFTYVNCGHNPPLLLRANGEEEYLVPGGPLLSILDDAAYVEGRVTLAEGDALILYTDGLVELFDTAYAEYGLDRLLAVAQRQRSQNAMQLIHGILADARSYARRETFSDDLTLLVVRRTRP